MNQTRWLSDFEYDREATPLLWSFDDPTQDVLTCKETSRSVSSPSILLLSDGCSANVSEKTRDDVMFKHSNELSSSPVESSSFSDSPCSKTNRYAQINYQESERLYLLSHVHSFPSYLTIGTAVEEDILVDCFTPTSPSRSHKSTDGEPMEEDSEMCAYENPAFEHDRYSTECFHQDYRELHSGTTKANSDPGYASDKNFLSKLSASASEDVCKRQSEVESPIKKNSHKDKNDVKLHTNTCYNPFHEAIGVTCQCMDIIDDVELTWDAYMPPLELRWSDIMIKDIFDLVEKDNEEHVKRIRNMVKKRDFRPFNILQRLCWYDEESRSVQSLVGVFEYDV